MTFIVNNLLSFLLLYKYIALFAMVFVSAVILPFPVSTVLLATGAFASQGYMSFWLSLFVAIGANMLGDTTGYFLARKYGPAVLKFLRIKESDRFSLLKDKMRQHVSLTIVITRFSGSLDVLANFVSGFICVPFSKFILFDFIGNVLSITPIIYVGYLAGNYWQQFSGLVGTIGGILLVIILIVIVIIFFVRRGKSAHKK